MRKRDDSGGPMQLVRRVVAAAAVALSVFLVVSVGGDSESATDLHVAVVSE